MSSALNRYQDAFVAWLQVGPCQRVEGTTVCRAETDRIDAGLAIYRDAYALRLVRSLSHDFPVSTRTLGEPGFAELARHYIDDHPFEKPDIHDVGARFPAWLSVHAGHSHGDLAAIEWAVLRAFSGADAEPMTIEEPGWCDPAQWPALRLTLVPSLSLLSLRSNAAKVWQHHPSQALPNLESSGEAHAVVWREGLTPRLCAVERPHYLVLQALEKQQRLADVCQQLRYRLLDDDIRQHVAATIHLGLEAGWFAKTVIPNVH